jgi:hypothetical protein
MRNYMLALVTLLTGTAALAADATLQSAQRCAQVQDSLQRLVCYDRLFPPGQVAAAPAVTAPAPTVIPAPVATPPPVTPAAGFGAESVRRTGEQLQAEAPPRSLTAAVNGVREMRPNVYRMTLENGQVWDQMEMDITFSVQAGDTVQIERGRMGGYRMTRTNRGGSGWVRVNRLK